MYHTTFDVKNPTMDDSMNSLTNKVQAESNLLATFGVDVNVQENDVCKDAARQSNDKESAASWKWKMFYKELAKFYKNNGHTSVSTASPFVLESLACQPVVRFQSRLSSFLLILNASFLCFSFHLLQVPTSQDELFKWTGEQRLQFRLFQRDLPSQLDRKRVELMEQLNFQWEIRPDSLSRHTVSVEPAIPAENDPWMRQYLQLKQYCSEHGTYQKFQSLSFEIGILTSGCNCSELKIQETL